MISKNQIQFIKSLSINKYRRVHNQFVAEGPKVTDELLNSSLRISGIFALPEWIRINKTRAQGDFEVFEVSEKELSRISNLKSPNQVLAVVKIPEMRTPINRIDDLVLMLDNISDPGNMGTIIRTADWFGIQSIICSENCVDIYNPKVVQATMGSLFRVEVYYADLKRYLSEIPVDQIIYGAFQDGDNLYETKLNQKSILIIGNEANGISNDLIPYISNKITIPDYAKDKQKSAESLNASIATAILCSEFRRQSK